MNSSQDSVIQCILDRVRKRQAIERIAMEVFDLVAIQKEFDIEQTVICERYLHGENIKLKSIEFEQLKRNYFAIKLLKVLYHLGICVDIDSGDLTYGWAQCQQIKSLQELGTMAVRRNCTRKELKEAIADIVLPDVVEDYFDLKHLTFGEEFNMDEDNSNHDFQVCDFDDCSDDYDTQYQSDYREDSD